MHKFFDQFRPSSFRADTRTWKDLVRDRRSPWRSAIGAGIGAVTGATPLIGFHTWIAATLGVLLPVPTLSVLAGSNLSNPLTFLPITYLEIRIGQFLLARPSGLSWDGISLEVIASYWLEAWVGFIVVGPLMGLLTLVILRAALARSHVR